MTLYNVVHLTVGYSCLMLNVKTHCFPLEFIFGACIIFIIQGSHSHGQSGKFKSVIIVIIMIRSINAMEIQSNYQIN